MSILDDEFSPKAAEQSAARAAQRQQAEQRRSQERRAPIAQTKIPSAADQLGAAWGARVNRKKGKAVRSEG